MANQPKTVAIIQARLGSTRLPGKVLADINGQPMLSRVFNRVGRANFLDDVIVAVPDSPRDAPLVQFCRQNNFPVVAGPETDVLSRYVKAARQFNAVRVVRITADCPLIDASIIDETVAVLHRIPDVDYACNFWPRRNHPRGLDTEVVTTRALIEVDRRATAPHYREHVTSWIYQNPTQFKLGANFTIKNYGHLRWTVDTASDLELVREIYRHFGERDFSWLDVVDAYREFPHWNLINQHVIQKAS